MDTSDLEPNLLHTRSWIILDDSISVIDKIENKQLSGFANFHFHPDAFVSMNNSGYEGVIKLKEKFLQPFQFIKVSRYKRDYLAPRVWNFCSKSVFMSQVRAWSK